MDDLVPRNDDHRGDLLLVKCSHVIAASWLALGVISDVRAQTIVSDSTPFHRGQWAVEFPIEASIGSGLMLFTSSNGALFIHPSATTRRDRRWSSDYGYHAERSSELAVRIGQRGYWTLADRTLGSFTLGVQPSWRWYSYESRATDAARPSVSGSTIFGFGVFADLGADYMITPHLSLGARIGFSVRRSRNVPSNSRGYSTTSSDVALPGSRVTAALYF